MVYKQEDKLTRMDQRIRDIDLGVKLLDKSISENKKGINKNANRSSLGSYYYVVHVGPTAPVGTVGAVVDRLLSLRFC